MVRVRPAGIPLSLLVAVTALALVTVHTIAHATVPGSSVYGDALADGVHDYWPLLVASVLVVAVVTALAARARTGFTRHHPTGGRRGNARLVARVWLVLALASLAGFVVLENVEVLAHSGSIVGLAPVELLAHLAALGPLAIAFTGLALAAVAVVVVGRGQYEAVLNESYAGLVADGVYTADFRQSPWAVTFVRRVVGGVLDRHLREQTLSILECGCGTGVWLEELAALTEGWPAGVTLSGFDLSSAMADAARARLDRAGVKATVRQGDIFDPAAYSFGADRHDIIVAYDVVQQLPADSQQTAVDAMVTHLAVGGALVIFDHDAQSRYGRLMGLKKWLRRYLGVPLVPRHYIHSRYPDLGRTGRRLEASGFRVDTVVEAEGRKRALVVRAETR